MHYLLYTSCTGAISGYMLGLLHSNKQKNIIHKFTLLGTISAPLIPLWFVLNNKQKEKICTMLHEHLFDS